MGRIRTLLGLAALVGGLSQLNLLSASAANSPTFRDCSLLAGADPDFVQLSGVTVGPGGALTVPAGQTQLGIEASESSDPGDSEGHDTLKVRVRSSHLHSTKVIGSAKGKVHLSVPLGDPKTGRSYTISWSAMFDNGSHRCPSKATPENKSPRPFVVVVQ
jgi:hypothetical protein